MARIVKDELYVARRNEILTAAMRFIYSKGYEQMTIQDILGTLQISKGAFYHYFNSKGELLEALIERMVVDEALPILNRIVEHPEKSALEKLHEYFDAGARWKTTQKSFMLAVLRVWMADENAIVRQKLFTMSSRMVTPLLSRIIRQGVAEGVFTTPYPDQVCQVIFYLSQGLSDTILGMLISDEKDRDATKIESAIYEYTNALNDAMERILGSPKGSVHLVAPATLNEWFVSPERVLES